MKTLTIVFQPGFTDPKNGLVIATVLVTPKQGDEFYLCNPMNEVIEAHMSGDPWIGHQVIGMQPRRIIIEPGTLARMREL